MLKKISIFIVVSFLNIAIPVAVFAQTFSGSNTNTSGSSAPTCSSLLQGNINNLKDIIDYGTCLITKSIIPLLFVIALAAFVYGVIQYFLNPQNIKEREAARKYIVGALIGMFVLFSISGIINIFRNTFGVDGNPIPLLPETQ